MLEALLDRICDTVFIYGFLRKRGECSIIVLARKTRIEVEIVILEKGIERRSYKFFSNQEKAIRYAIDHGTRMQKRFEREKIINGFDPESMVLH